MATPKKPAPGKKVFTATSTSEKQQNINTRTGTADMRSKATPAPKPAKPIIGRTSQNPKIKAQLEAKVKKTPNIKISGSSYVIGNNKPSAMNSGSRKVTSNDSKPSALSNVVNHITENFRVTKKEAGDIVKAVKNVGTATYSNARVNSLPPVKALAKDVIKQVGETAKAAATGKSGTTAAKLKPDNSKLAQGWGDNKTVYKGSKVVPGKKR